MIVPHKYQEVHELEGIFLEKDQYLAMKSWITFNKKTIFSVVNVIQLQEREILKDVDIDKN